MPDREKVIRGLEACNRQSYNGSDCQNCPYYDDEDTAELAFGICNIQDMFDDALALLKEQEPRVMTREEVLTLPEGAVVWFEERSDDSRDYIGPLVSDGNGFFGDFGRGVDMHAAELKRKRCWTSRPTEEQRKAVPWEDDDAD